jgi:phage baseplate assembly protein W
MQRDPNVKAFLGRGWAYTIGFDQQGAVALAEYEEDVREGILIVLGTNHGERVMRPDFGAGLRDFLFEPISTTTMALLQHRVEEALITWEPRIDSITVSVESPTPELGRVDIEITYRVRLTNTFYNLVYPFYVEEGRVSP